MSTAILCPHYNTPTQLTKLLAKIPAYLYSQILVVDDGSESLPELPSTITLIKHSKQLGYGAAQKTGYKWFLESDFEQIILLHGDDQYEFQTIWEAQDKAQLVQLASRILVPSPEFYPRWRKFGNQVLTAVANRLYHTQYTDLHTGGRIYHKDFLQSVPFLDFSDDFLFDQQILAYCLRNQIQIKEFPIIPKYDESVSSISFRTSLQYGLGCLKVLLEKN